MKPTHIVIHHTATPRDKTTFKAVNEYHKKKWDFKSSLGYYCGYHYFIETDGKITQARANDEMGAHCKADGMNHKSIGIGLTGDFTKEVPSDAQLKSLEKLVLDLEKKYNIERKENVIGHREAKGAQTSCPGFLIYWVLAHRYSGRLDPEKGRRDIDQIMTILINLSKRL